MAERSQFTTVISRTLLTRLGVRLEPRGITGGVWIALELARRLPMLGTPTCVVEPPGRWSRRSVRCLQTAESLNWETALPQFTEHVRQWARDLYLGVCVEKRCCPLKRSHLGVIRALLPSVRRKQGSFCFETRARPNDFLLPFCAPERLVDVERFGMCSELYSIGALLLWTMVEDETEFQNSPIAIVEKFMSDGPEMYDQSTRERVGQVFLRTLHTEEN